MSVVIQANEIRDYINRAPKGWSFRGGRMVNSNYVRFAWLMQLSRGTIDERINRRAGIPDRWRPWSTPVVKACQRHARRQARRLGR